ncbi:MAG: ABC-2 family transporter protein [Chloroflexota bacterium]|nr:ABC-2 family transporter protein [Chloroflexota bacterium]
MSAIDARPVSVPTKRRPRYPAIAQTAAQQAVAYRITTLTSIVGNFFWIAILYYLWQAAFAQQGRIGSFTWDEMRTYILLAYGLNALVGFTTASRMMQTIRTGDVVLDMVRPLNYLRVQLAQTIGLAVVEGLVSFSIILALGVAVVRIVPPASPLAAVLFAVSTAMGLVTKFLVVFAVSLLCFWTINAVGLNWAQLAVINVLSGTLVPIQFLPGWLQSAAEWSPLRGIVATPVGIYLGQYEGRTLLAALALQAAWLVALWAAADRAWPRAFRAVEAQGG